MPKKLLIFSAVAAIVVISAALFVQSLSKKQINEKPVSGELPIGMTSIDLAEKQAADDYGQVLAGRTTKYVVYNSEGYEKAVNEGKTIMLNFYANWCPVCRGEEPELLEGFNGLNNPDVIAFRVNFNDSDTENAEKMLADEFKIPYQHTKVILKNSREVSRSDKVWDKDDLIRELSSI